MGQGVLAIVQGQLNVIKPEEKLQLARLKASLSDRLTPTRDTNGFRKLLVLLSKSGMCIYREAATCLSILMLSKACGVVTTYSLFP